jgi:hypothetical protein
MNRINVTVVLDGKLHQQYPPDSTDSVEAAVKCGIT